MTEQKRSRNIRKRKALDEEEEAEEEAPQDGSLRETLEATRLLQKLRGRKGGIDADSLLAGVTTEDIDEVLEQKPGVANDLLTSYVKEHKKEEGDIDPHMQKYIDEQMAKRLGKHQQQEGDEGAERRRKEEEDLYHIPEDLKGAVNTRSADPAGAWVTGILEVELPMEYKLKNIEETEAAKKRMLQMTRATADDDDDDNEGGAAPAIHRAEWPRDFGHRNAKLEQVRIQTLKAFRKKQ